MIKDGLVDIDDISVLKEAEKCASRLCCADCKALICEEKCECWNFAKKGVEFGYNKTKEIIKELIDDWMSMEGDEIRELKSVKEAEELLQSLSK